MSLSSTDIQQLAARGIDPHTAEHQLGLLRAGQAWTLLERPCTPGDGILQVTADKYLGLTEHFDRAAEAGRLLRFVPASGAASRMFKPLFVAPDVLSACQSLLPAGEVSDAERELRRFNDELTRFAFFDDLEQTMADAGEPLGDAMANRDLGTIIRYLLEPCGLGYALLPKGLLAFHKVADGARTPFVEHQAEAALLNGSENRTRLHFTVTPEHQPLFEAQFAAWQSLLQETYGCRIEVDYSAQKPSTDTLALGDDDQPFRDEDGALLFRPGGHGALIENLNELDGDIVLIRNIDNVVPDTRKAANLLWARVLTGVLLELQEEQHALIRSLTAQPDEMVLRELALAFLCDRLQTEVPFDASVDRLIELLDRPLRVCGMVPVSGEPGGGPFWVRHADGRLSRQIVEGAQINMSDAGQVAILKKSTHFNPVDMVCALRDWRGEPYDLHRFIDREAVIVTEKSQGGQIVRALELPGLWNGAMAEWHTLFVEIPPEAFNPVKTVFDLLRPAHQP